MIGPVKEFSYRPNCHIVNLLGIQTLDWTERQSTDRSATAVRVQRSCSYSDIIKITTFQLSSRIDLAEKVIWWNLSIYKCRWKEFFFWKNEKKNSRKKSHSQPSNEWNEKYLDIFVGISRNDSANKYDRARINIEFIGKFIEI